MDEKNLKNSEREIDLERFFMSMFESLISISPDLKVLEASNEFLEKRGLKLENVVGKGCWEITGHSEPCAGGHHVCPASESIKSGKFASAVHLHDVKGETQYHKVTTAPIFNNKGSLVKILHGIKDVTQIELKRQEREAVYSHFMKTGLAIYETDMFGNFILTNPSFVELLGYGSCEDLKKINARDIHANPYKYDSLMDELIKRGKISNLEIDIRKKNESIVPINTNLVLSGRKVKGVVYEVGENIIPVCMYCELIRDEAQGKSNATWIKPIKYFSNQGIKFSHGICDPCMDKHHSDE